MNQRRADSFAVDRYYGRNPLGVTINSLANGFGMNRRESRRAYRTSLIKPALARLSVDEPSCNLFENSFRLRFNLLLRLVLDRVRDVDRIKV